jgi:hypothetical protein
MRALLKEAEGGEEIGKSGDRKAKSLPQITQMSADQKRSRHRGNRRTGRAKKPRLLLRASAFSVVKIGFSQNPATCIEIKKRQT